MVNSIQGYYGGASFDFTAVFEEGPTSFGVFANVVCNIFDVGLVLACHTVFQVVS